MLAHLLGKQIRCLGPAGVAQGDVRHHPAVRLQLDDRDPRRPNDDHLADGHLLMPGVPAGGSAGTSAGSSACGGRQQSHPKAPAEQAP